MNNLGSGCDSRISSKDIVVVIPAYKTQLNEVEKSVLRQCLRVLENYDICWIHPVALDLSPHQEIIPQAQATAFDNHYFRNIEGYNKLLISKRFYQRFARYKYMLIHQTDAWVFEDSLLMWCDKGYDFVGAPWLEKPTPMGRPLLWDFTKLCVNQVGNGGLSLRRVATCQRIAGLLKPISWFYRYNEDVFWSLFVPLIFRSFKKPSCLDALHFAFEYNPRESYQRIGNHLPFGCHAWERTDREFWNQFIYLR